MKQNRKKEKIFVAVPVTLEYDPSRVSLEELVPRAERGLTNAMHHIAGYYRIEGGCAQACSCPLEASQTIQDLRFALKQALDQRDLLSVKVSQLMHLLDECR